MKYVVIIVSLCSVASSSPVFAQQKAERTKCEQVGTAQPPRVDLPSLTRDVASNRRKADELLRDLRTFLGERTTCASATRLAEASFVFVWATDGAPNAYVLHDTPARAPRDFLPGSDPPLVWFEVTLARTREELERTTTEWAAAQAAPAGGDPAAWFQQFLVSAAPAIGAYFPTSGGITPSSVGQPPPVLQWRMSRIETDILPAKLTVSASTRRPVGGLKTLAEAWRKRSAPVFKGSVAEELLETYARALGEVACADISACVELGMAVVTGLWNSHKCRTDSDCIALTNTVRQWLAELPRTEVRTIVRSFSAERPKRWAFGTFLGVVDLPDDVETGEVVRVKVGGDSRLSRDAFTRTATGFIAARAFRAHQPEFWGLANAGAYAGVLVTPNVGITYGIQWRFWRQLAAGVGRSTIWYATGEPGTLISTSNPLEKAHLSMWTFGFSFTADAR